MLVSVVIPAHNAGSFLAEAVESALEAGEGAWEVVVVDDGTTDGSVESLRNRCGDRVAFAASSAAPSGPSAARNRGQDAARGEVAIFLDADDVLLPSSRDMARRLLEEPAGIVVGSWLDANEVLEPFRRSNNVPSGNDALALLLERPTVASAVALRRPWPRWLEDRRVWEVARWQHDAALEHPVVCAFEEAVAIVRQHDSSRRLTISEDHFDPLVCASFWAEEKQRLAGRLSERAAAAIERRLFDAIYQLVRTGRDSEAKRFWSAVSRDLLRTLALEFSSTYRIGARFGLRGLRAHALAARVRNRTTS